MLWLTRTPSSLSWGVSFTFNLFETSLRSAVFLIPIPSCFLSLPSSPNWRVGFSYHQLTFSRIVPPPPPLSLSFGSLGSFGFLAVRSWCLYMDLEKPGRGCRCDQSPLFSEIGSPISIGWSMSSSSRWCCCCCWCTRNQTTNLVVLRATFQILLQLDLSSIRFNFGP